MSEAAGLFYKAIVQSACIEHFFTEEESGVLTKVYMRLIGARTARELVDMPQGRVRQANSRNSAWLLRRGDIWCAFSPVVDGVALTAEPKEAAKARAFPCS
jgi:carboxylesterase type B